MCGASDPDTQKLIDWLLAEHGPYGFAAAFLEARGLGWAADLLRDFPGVGAADANFHDPDQKELPL